MRNKEQEFAWRKVIEACMEDTLLTNIFKQINSKSKEVY